MVESLNEHSPLVTIREDRHSQKIFLSYGHDEYTVDAKRIKQDLVSRGRDWLLNEIDDWLQDEPNSRVFWLVGGPGIGKTAIAAHRCHNRRDASGKPRRT